LKNAWIELIKRHDALRTSFEIINEKPIQRVWENVDFKIDYRVAGEEEAIEITEAFFIPFDLAKAPLLRVGL